MSMSITEIIDNVVVLQTTNKEIFIGTGMSNDDVYTTLQYAIQIDNSNNRAYPVLNVSDITKTLLLRSSVVYTISRPDTKTLEQYFKVVEYYCTPVSDNANIHYVDTIQ